jgi:subtilisin family serine protease
MRALVRFALALAGGVVLGTVAAAQTSRESQTSQPTPTDKLDADLVGGSGLVPIFVRMTDQLLPGGGSYQTFCREHRTGKRSELRARILADLRRRGERSFAALQQLVGRETERGGLRDVTRFWIVNGFAADADAKACAALATRSEVAFVYRQRGPGGIVQHRARGAGRAGWDRAALERALQTVALEEAPFSAADLVIPWNLQRVQADRAWQLGATGDGVVVAVLDSGLLPIPPLVQALWRNPKETLDGKDEDGNGCADDVFGWDFTRDVPDCLGDEVRPHGSMCAGIVAGRPFGEPRTLTGVAPRARIMVLRGGGLLRAYEYAASNGADVLSMSYTWIDVELGHYRGLYRTAHEHLAAAGVLSVGGAGNFARSHPAGRQIACPKDIPCVLAVAGVVEDGTRPPFSSQGPVTWQGVRFFDDYPPSAPLLKPDLTACNGGFPVWTRLPTQQGTTVWKSPDGDFGLAVGPRGNSFAGPHVAGVAALVWSANHELYPWQVTEILEQTAQDLGEQGPDLSYGKGLVQAAAAVEAARQRR